MRRCYRPGPFGWPEWLRVLVITSLFGPVFLFFVLLGYGTLALIGNGLGLYSLPVGPELFDPSSGDTFTIAAFSSLAGPLFVAGTAAVIWEARWQWEYRRPYWREERDAKRYAKAAKQRARVAQPAAGRPGLWGNAFCALAFVLILAVWLSGSWRERHGAIPAPAPTTIVREGPLPASTHLGAK